jgi:hypothetical protein
MNFLKRQIVLALVAFLVMVGALAVFAQTTTTVPAVYDGQTLMGSKLRAAFTAICAAIDTKPDKTQLVVTRSTTVIPASQTIVIPGTTSFANITAATATGVHTLSIGTSGAVDGQVMYILNSDASPTAGLAVINQNKVGVIFFASPSWRLVADE